ncbi:hypothetical protein BTVI_157537 [Pitangus sulphuratus]|nr:hypothetical protein BTVI_157537 [Pitangus sulphuratus]
MISEVFSNLVDSVNFSKGKLPSGRNNPRHQDTTKCKQSSFAEKTLGVLVDTRLTMSQQWVLAAKVASSLLGCTEQHCQQGKGGHPSFCSAPVGQGQGCCVQSWALWYKRDLDLMEHFQQKATKIIKGLELLSYEERLRAAPVQLW